MPNNSIDKPRSEEVDPHADLRALWGMLCSIHAKKGLDLEKALNEWASAEAQQLPDPGARSDFEELCREGCTPLILAALMACLRWAPALEKFWELVVGDTATRVKTIRAIEKAIGALESLFGDLNAFEDQESKARFERVGRIPPPQLLGELRLYVRLLNMAENLGVTTDTRSLPEFLRYLLAGYVRLATGRFRDRSVSGLLAYLDHPNFDEVAQRMWRARNYDRLDKQFHRLSEFLHASSLVIARPSVTNS